MCRISRIARSCARITSTGLMAALLLSTGGEAQAGGVQDDDEARESTTEYYEQGGRARTSLKTRTVDRFGALETHGLRVSPRPSTATARTSAKTSAVESKQAADDFWLYYADVQLFNDRDDDGYFHGIDLLFDADTYYQEADVYAVLYLSYEGGPWNEYAATEPFTIFGATSDDEYVVVTELESGYPTGSYDLLIELYDTWDGSFVAELGPEHDSGLSLLPLEDFHRDDPHRHSRHRHGGGSLAWPLVLVLLAIRALPRAAGRPLRSA